MGFSTEAVGRPACVFDSSSNFETVQERKTRGRKAKDKIPRNSVRVKFWRVNHWW